MNKVRWYTARWKTGVIAFMILYAPVELTRYIILYMKHVSGFEWKFVGEMGAIWFTFFLGMYSTYVYIKRKRR